MRQIYLTSVFSKGESEHWPRQMRAARRARCIMPAPFTSTRAPNSRSARSSASNVLCVVPAPVAADATRPGFSQVGFIAEHCRQTWLAVVLNPPAAINHGLAGRNDSLSVLRETDVKTGNAGVEVHAGQPISGRRNIGSKGESLPARAPFFLGSTASNS